jgi:hypothetical protein
MKLLNHVRTIGPAIWLFLLYQNNAEYSGDQTWAPVLNLRPIRDRETAEALKVPLHTAIRWRRRVISRCTDRKSRTGRRCGPNSSSRAFQNPLKNAVA